MAGGLELLEAALPLVSFNVSGLLAFTETCDHGTIEFRAEFKGVYTETRPPGRRRRREGAVYGRELCSPVAQKQHPGAGPFDAGGRAASMASPRAAFTV